MSANKENQESEQAELQSVASPRISSTGAGGSEDAAGSARPSAPQARQRVPQGYDHHDWVHWGGVGQRLPHDARSVASSAAADRDDKSIFEEPGALDAPEEGDEEEHLRDDVEEEEEAAGEGEGEGEEEAPEEISLTQVQDDLRAVQLRSESSNVESTFTAISGPASLADVVEQLADQAVAGELSPRQAAAAIRSATRQHSGGLTGLGGAGGGAGEALAGDDGEGGGSLMGSPSAAAAEAGTDLLTADGLEGSDVASVSGGAAHSSIAPSEEGWHQGSGALAGGSSSSGAAPSADAGVAGSAGAGSGSGSGAEVMDTISLEGPSAEAAVVAAPAAEEEEREEEKEEEEQAAAEAPVEADKHEEAGEPLKTEIDETAAQEALAAEAEAAPAAEPEAAPAADAEAVAPVVGGVPLTASNGYKSQLMQQLTAEEEEDITVYSAADAGTKDFVAPGPADAPVVPAAAAGAAGTASRIEPLSVESGAAPAAAGGVGTMSEADKSAALAAINASGGSSAAAQAAAPGEEQQGQQAAPALLFPPAWYEAFKGLLYMDGVDSLGRPVVVLNADAVPANMKSSALVFVKAHLEPLVNQGDYVIVFTSRGHAKLPSMWIMGAWRSLPRPFRKHVQYIILVRPSAFLRAVLAFMRPFVSKKAGRKIKQVQSMAEISAATNGEVTMQSLGDAFAADQSAHDEAEAARNGGDASP